jgi:hypothetical protein
VDRCHGPILGAPLRVAEPVVGVGGGARGAPHARRAESAPHHLVGELTVEHGVGEDDVRGPAAKRLPGRLVRVLRSERAVQPSVAVGVRRDRLIGPCRDSAPVDVQRPGAPRGDVRRPGAREWLPGHHDRLVARLQAAALRHPLRVHPLELVADLEPRVLDARGESVVRARGAEGEEVTPRLQHAQALGRPRLAPLLECAGTGEAVPRPAHEPPRQGIGRVGDHGIHAVGGQPAQDLQRIAHDEIGTAALGRHVLVSSLISTNTDPRLVVRRDPQAPVSRAARSCPTVMRRQSSGTTRSSAA